MGSVALVEEINPYKGWIKEEGIPIIEEYYVDDAMEVPLQPWPRTGGKGAYIDLVGSDNLTGAYLCEITPGGSLNPEKHLFEELIYVLSGKGTACVWNEDSSKQSFEWQERSLFSPPLNCWHQLFNSQKDEPARFFAVTGAPVCMNLFHNSDFIFNNNFVFKDRYAGQSNYFNSEGRLICLTNNEGKPIESAGPVVLEKNIIKDVLDVLNTPELSELEQIWNRPFKRSSLMVNMVPSDDTMEAHIREYEPLAYNRAHRHEGGAHIIFLSSEGYSLMWPDGGAKMRFDWHKGTILSPPENWWHMHCTTGTEPEIHLALRWCGHRYRFNSEWRYLEKPNTIEYHEEDPEIRRSFEAQLAKKGLKSKIDDSLYRK